MARYSLMRWSDDGIFLQGRPFGETSVIADIFTRGHGRTLGLIKGGRSRRMRPLLQGGNLLQVEWRARLDDQLGVYTIDLTDAIAAGVLDNALALAGLTSICALVQLFPERDPHPNLFDEAKLALTQAGADGSAGSYVRFEVALLRELGFGLNLAQCAVTGSVNDLIYVSPKSGNAVSRIAGEPYRDKLLRLPGFLIDGLTADISDAQEVIDGLALTGYFLETHLAEQSGTALPGARQALCRMLAAAGSCES